MILSNYLWREYECGNVGFFHFSAGFGVDILVTIDASVNWKSHNYTPLMEQPTLLYAVVLVLE